MRIDNVFGLQNSAIRSSSLLDGVAKIIGSVARNDFGSSARLINSNNSTAINIGQIISKSGSLIESAGFSIGQAGRSSDFENLMKAAGDMFSQAANLMGSLNGLLNGDKFGDALGHFQTSGQNLQSAAQALGNAAQSGSAEDASAAADYARQAGNCTCQGIDATEIALQLLVPVLEMLPSIISLIRDQILSG